MEAYITDLYVKFGVNTVNSHYLYVYMKLSLAIMSQMIKKMLCFALLLGLALNDIYILF